MSAYPPISTFSAPNDNVVSMIQAVVGPKGVIARDDYAPYLREWRDRWHGQAAMIVAPASPEEVAAIVKICAEYRVAITPQGGNTGLVGGQIPFGPEILMSLKRLRQVRNVEPLNDTMTVDAGLTLAEVQDAAARVDRLFPLSIGSEGTCQIGGIISTNAGGVNVLRYGNTRDLVLGIEAVLPNGEIYHGLKRLRKDNTGYDVKQLLIGGEGTLGIVTGAVLKLFAQPAEKITAFVGVERVEHAVTLLSLTQATTGGNATSFELMSRQSVDLVTTHTPEIRDPFSAVYPWYVLMEISASETGRLRNTTETMLAAALEKNIISDAVIAESEAQSQMLWRMRHSISHSINQEGRGARHDVSVATSDIPAFLDTADVAVQSIVKGARIVAFGHIGDGNIHYDVIAPHGAAQSEFDNARERVQETVYDVIQSFNGSISAEHGVGRHKRDVIAMRKSETELAAMHAIKSALDPKGIMNPGKMLNLPEERR